MGIVLPAALVGLLLYAGRGSAPTPTQPSIAASAGCKELRPGIAPCEGYIAPDFTALTIDGRQLSLSSLRGKVVVLWFMAAWCPSCAGVASLLQQQLASRPDVAAVVIDMWSEVALRQYGLLNSPGSPAPEGPAQLASFLRSYGSSSWYAVVDTYDLTRLYRLKLVDTTLIIDRQGKVVLRGDGPTSPQLLTLGLQRAGL